MLRAQHVRSLSLAAAGAWLGLALSACQGPDEFSWHEASGFAGNSPSGAAGTFVSGVAGTSGGGGMGNSGPGAAGSILTGSGGSAGGGVGGEGGAGATSGAAGAMGAAGRGGTTGNGGSAAGRGGGGGATGSGGSAGGRGGTTGGGPGGTTGAAGSSGRGGTAGTAGAGGRAGTTGTGGRAGATGTGGSGRGGASGAGGSGCPLGGRLDCSATGALVFGGDGQIVDFSTGQWNATTAKFCDGHGLDGSLSSFAGTGSTAAAVVDTTAQNLKLNFMVTGGQYAGGRVNFDSCVDARAFNSVQFTASVTAGSLNGCTWQLQLQTQDQRPTTATNPTGGTCNATTTTCERYPAATLAAATATATMYTTRFTAFTSMATSAVPVPSEITGLQWQVNSNNGTGSCTVELHVDNVKFVTQ